MQKQVRGRVWRMETKEALLIRFLREKVGSGGTNELY